VFGEWTYCCTVLGNVDRVGNEAKNEPSEGLSTVNVSRTGHEAQNPASYIMMIMMMAIVKIVIKIIMFSIFATQHSSQLYLQRCKYLFYD